MLHLHLKFQSLFSSISGIKFFTSKHTNRGNRKEKKDRCICFITGKHSCFHEVKDYSWCHRYFLCCMYIQRNGIAVSIATIRTSLYGNLCQIRAPLLTYVMASQEPTQQLGCGKACYFISRLAMGPLLTKENN